MCKKKLPSQPADEGLLQVCPVESEGPSWLHL